jgi:hypothetical protein
MPTKAAAAGLRPRRSLGTVNTTVFDQKSIEMNHVQGCGQAPLVPSKGRRGPPVRHLRLISSLRCITDPARADPVGISCFFTWTLIAAPLQRQPTARMVEPIGIEPMTSCLQSTRSPS